MQDSNTRTTLQLIHYQLENPMMKAVFSHVPLTGSHPYADNANPIDFIMDGLGAFSDGVIGHNWADSFTGSYDQHYTVIYRGPHTATAYFTVESQTNLNVPILGAIPIHSVSLPWDAGPFSEIDQVFQWQETVHY